MKYKLVLLSIVLMTVFLFGHYEQIQGVSNAFYIPFLTKNNYNAVLDESLDSEDNATEFYNGSDY